MNKEHFTEDLYIEKTHSISFLKANLLALLYPLPLVIPYILVYFISLGSRTKDSAGSISVNGTQMLLGLFLFFVATLALVLLHELTHAVFFLPACENGRKSIRFGITSATPYCHCEEVIPIRNYRISCLAPLFTVCLPLAVYSSVTGNLMVFFLTVMMLFGSGGDLYIVWALRKYSGKDYVYDLDDAVGCRTYVATPPGASPSITEESRKDK